MCHIGMFPLVAVLMIGAAGFSAKAVSGELSRPDRPAGATTLGAYWYYCTPEYYCRAFSTVCGYIRPLYSGDYRSKTYCRPAEPRDGRRARAAWPRPRSRHPVGTEKTAPLERYGTFTRIKAPGNAARWMRSDTFVPAN